MISGQRCSQGGHWRADRRLKTEQHDVQVFVVFHGFEVGLTLENGLRHDKVPEETRILQKYTGKRNTGRE